MLDGIADAESFVAGMTLQQYRADNKTRRAVERSLEIISEASRRIPDGPSGIKGTRDWMPAATSLLVLDD
jgi:uncharacterized protein with HEPN domain